MTAQITTNALPVAQALATPYQRELLSMLSEEDLREVGDYSWPDGTEGPLELTAGARTLRLPAREPGLGEVLEQLAENPQMYARMWARLYDELRDMDAPHARAITALMDRIAGEELGHVRPAAGQEEMPIDEAWAGGRLVSEERTSYAPGTTCDECGLPGGYHGDACQSPAAREARGLEPIRPAPGRRR